MWVNGWQLIVYVPDQEAAQTEVPVLGPNAFD
jgi:hypothetical protein